MRVYQFSDTATAKAPDITAEKLIESMKLGNAYVFGVDNLMRDGVFKLNGWAFNIQSELTLYLVKQYGQWTEVYAPNRTTLRKLTYGRIDAIKEL